MEIQSRKGQPLVAEGAATLPSLEMILAVAGRLSEGDKDTVRKLREMLAHSVLLAPRRRESVVRWRLGGETEIPILQYGVHQVKGAVAKIPNR